MPFTQEIRGSLAKCLATENILVEHKNIPTAMFDVDRRILSLPNWNKASETVYQLLILHEISHAIWTPNIDWTINHPNVPKDFVNVVEDARVEKLCKKKYPGSSRTFYNGYNELNTDDFFSTKDENLNELSFIDRINLYFKIGAFHNIVFTDQEDEFLTRISRAETFDEVLEICEDLAKFVKEKKQKVSNLSTSRQQDESGSTNQESADEESESSDEEQGEGKNENQLDLDQSSQGQSQNGEQSFGDEITKSQETSSGGGYGQEASNKHGERDELKSKTSQSFDEKSQELIDKYAYESNYVELPELKLENLILPNAWIHQKATEHYNVSSDSWMNEPLKECDRNYQTFKKSAEKEVSYLVKEFECKKSADQYARCSTARTGVLDTSKLHTYKFNEDLFKKVSVIPDGKNHGLIFILDWSGSMDRVILDTIKQLYNLIWFCRKVNIPFEVYAFTLDCSSYIDLQPNHPEIANLKAGMLGPEKSFRLMNFFTSSVNNRTLEEQMKNVWRCATAFVYRRISNPRHMDLSGSPIGESIMSLHQLIPHFQSKNKLQKVNVIFMTDGEGYVNASTVERKSYTGTYIGYAKLNKTTIRDRKTGRIYASFEYGNFPKYSKVLLQTVKDKFPMVNLINFRITNSRELSNCFHWYGADDKISYETAKKKFDKEKFLTFFNAGYDQFNILPSNSLSQDETFQVEEGASKAQIKTAFTKMLNNKRTNKKLLSSFVELIA